MCGFLDLSLVACLISLLFMASLLFLLLLLFINIVVAVIWFIYLLFFFVALVNLLTLHDTPLKLTFN